MTRLASQSAALIAALLVTVVSLNSVVTVPAANAAVIATPLLA